MTTKRGPFRRRNRLPGLLDRVRGALGLLRSSKGGAQQSVVEATQNWRAEDYLPPLIEDTAARDPWDPIAPKADQTSRDLPVSLQDRPGDHSPVERPVSRDGTSESDSHLGTAPEEHATQAGASLGAEEWQRLEDAEADAAEAAANPSADIIGGGPASAPILEPTLEVRVAPTDDRSADTAPMAALRRCLTAPRLSPGCWRGASLNSASARSSESQQIAG